MAEGREARSIKKILLVINCILVAIGNTGGPLLMRLYYLEGGHRVWLSCFLQTVCFPIMLIPLSLSYLRRRSAAETTKAKIISIKTPLFFLAAFIGTLNGLVNFLYAYSVARIPVSTSVLILSTQLAFVAFFSYVLVRQRFTAYSINAVVLLMLGAGVLAMHASGDRPNGESTKEYVKGFVTGVVAVAIYGFVLPLMELSYKNPNQRITYSLVMEFQFVLCFASASFCAIGMIINNDFQAIPREAKNFKHGEANYYALLVGTALVWQTFYIGVTGVVFCASSLLSGIIIAVFLPVTEVLAVIIYKEKFQAEKGVSLLLSLWGFVSYFYGEIKQAKKIKKSQTSEPTRASEP